MDMYCDDELFLLSFQTGIVGDGQIRSQGDSEANARLLTFQLKSGGKRMQTSHVLFWNYTWLV